MFKKIRKQENLGKIKVNAILKTSVRSIIGMFQNMLTFVQHSPRNCQISVYI